MSKFEIDDNVEIINVNFLTKHERSTFNVKIGDKGKIIGFYKPSPVFAIVANNNFTNSNAGEGKLFVPVSSLQKLNSFYLESNRYKLSQAIKSTGFHAENLSLESGHAKTYFTGFTAESRFNSRGDITEDRLNSLLTTLAFAERNLLGVGAKTVDNVKSISNDLLETNIKETLSDLDAALKSNQSDTNKSNLNKFLIIFVLALLGFALGFFVR